ncbi:MAG: tRNA 2-thiouridine(34) synthase MnmA [Candidatus Nanopelagicales bacterium]
MRVVAALSGGVDSAVAAARAVEAGHDVVGIHLALARNAHGATGSRGCCTPEDARDARRVADVLGIPFYVWDLSEQFAEDVMDDFVSEYAAGRTPNPCLRCNERIKFSAVLDRALGLGFDAVATGHYARIVEGPRGRELHRAADGAKDQSYVLAVLDERQLAGAMFPLGGSTKDEVRAEAARRGLLVADKPDSTDICFVPDGDTGAWLRDRLGEAPGDVVDAESGQTLGRHDGAYAFTVGQRRGLHLGRPAEDGGRRYVVGVDVASSTVLVGPPVLLEVDRVEGLRPRWCGPAPEAPVEGAVQLRAHGDPVAAVVVREDGPDGERVVASLRTRARGVAPGQALVVYDGTRVVGSATISRTSRS